MKRNKSAAIWIVWFSHSTGWAPLEVRHDKDGATVVMEMWQRRMPAFKYTVTRSRVRCPVPAASRREREGRGK